MFSLILSFLVLIKNCTLFLIRRVSMLVTPAKLLKTLKVPKCKIFNLFSLDDFNGMKCLEVGDLGAEIKKYIFFFNWARYVSFYLC
jgi:hypothetical protein